MKDCHDILNLYTLTHCNKMKDWFSWYFKLVSPNSPQQNDNWKQWITLNGVQMLWTLKTAVEYKKHKIKS